MSLFGCLAYLGMGGSVYADIGNSHSVISDNLSQGPTIKSPTEILTDLAIPEIKIRNGMMFVPPRSDINYKIAKVAPDPGIDYKIHIVGQKLRSSLMG